MKLAWTALALATIVGCSSGPPARPGGLLRNDDAVSPSGVRIKPVTAEEVGEMVRKKIGAIHECYARERLNTPNPSALVFELDIPTDGSGHQVALVSASDKGQIILEACVSDILKALDFPSHSGQPLKVKVPFNFDEDQSGR